MAMNFSRSVGGLHFENPLILGAGTCKTEADTLEALRSAVTGVEIGSITPKPLPGNGGKTFHAEFRKGVLMYTLNSLGMPNPGMDATGEWLPDVIRFAHQNGKRIGVNVAANSVEGLLIMVAWAAAFKPDWVTINAGCPNKYVDGVPQQILTFDFKDMEDFLSKLADQVDTHDVHIWWKPSPENDTLVRQAEMFRMLANCPAITGLVLINTVPHCAGYNDDGIPAITLVNGSRSAGMGGPAVKPKMLGDVERVRCDFDDRFVIIGAGGVTTGKDIDNVLCAGADGVEYTSAFWAYGRDHRYSSELLREYAELFEE